MSRFSWSYACLLAAVVGGCGSSGSGGGSGSPKGGSGDGATQGDTSSGNAADDGRDGSGARADAGADSDTHLDGDGGAVTADPPTLGDPCGTDLDVHNGSVRPDFGVVPKGPAFSGDPLAAGPFQVLESPSKIPNPDATLADVPLSVYAPSVDGKTVAAGKHPLVVVLPGYGKGFGLTLAGTYPTYAFFTKHFVSHGFIAVGMNFVAGGLGVPLAPATVDLGAHFLTAQEKNVAEVEAVLDWALSKSSAKDSIDASKIAIAGHSEGGKVAFFVAVEDPRIDVVLGWDPQNAGGGSPCGVPGGEMCDRLPIAPNCKAMDPGRMNELHAETLVFAARDKNTIPDTHQWAENFYRGAPSPAHMLLFPDASTESFSDGDNPVAQTTMRAQLALLLTRFAGVAGLDDYVPGGAKLVVEGVKLEQHDK